MSCEGNPQEWLQSAESDRRAAKHLLESGDYEPCAFHCQQAVEKLLNTVDPGIFVKPLAEKAVQYTDEIFKWFLTRIVFENE